LGCTSPGSQVVGLWACVVAADAVCEWMAKDSCKRLLLERVVITGDHVAIEHVIPLSGRLPACDKGIDVLACVRCGGRMRVEATIDDPVVIRRILTHLGLPTNPLKTSSR